MRASLASILLLAAAAGCAKRDNSTDQAQHQPTTAATEETLAPAVATVVAEANKRIVARQGAVKAWSTVKVPEKDAPACAQAPKIKIWVDGFKLGTSEARKVMVIESADEIAGKPDPSIDPSIAKDLESLKHAERSAPPSPLGWAQLDYTTDEYPFAPGARAEAFQLAFGMAKLKSDQAGMTKALDELKKDEVVIIAQKRDRTVVTGKTFTAGAMVGTALLWSYEKSAVVCAGHFDATNTSAEFRGGKLQVGSMPEEEVEARAFQSAAASLRALP